MRSSLLKFFSSCCCGSKAK